MTQCTDGLRMSTVAVPVWKGIGLAGVRDQDVLIGGNGFLRS